MHSTPETVSLWLLPALNASLHFGQPSWRSGAACVWWPAVMLQGGTRRPRRPFLLLSSEIKPVEEAQARDTIAIFLLNERKNKIIANDMSSLRSSAKIDYISDFWEAKKS